MGTCFSSVDQEQLEESDILNSDEISVKNQQNRADLKKQKTIAKNKYRSELLNPNIKDTTIKEEESYIIGNSYFSALEDSVPKQQRSMHRTSSKAMYSYPILTEYMQKHPLGQEIDSQVQILIQNVQTGKYLHSHAIKYEVGSKQHEVSGCVGNDQEYDQWIMLCDHNGSVQNEDIIIMHHPLTNCNMRASQRFQSQKAQKNNQLQVCCANSLQNIQNDDYWKIEIIGNEDILYENSLIIIKHVQTDGTLQVSKSRAMKPNQMEIIVSNQSDVKEIWVVKNIDKFK